MNFLKNKNVIVVLVILVVLIGGGLLLTNLGSDSASKDDDDVLPDVELLPTVGPEVEVTLEADPSGEEVILQIAGVPDGTDFIEYELSYDAIVDDESVPKGVIGTITFDGEDPVTRDIILGTCSSGTCKYDEGVEAIKATLKFEGDYGAQLFEGEFEI